MKIALARAIYLLGWLVVAAAVAYFLAEAGLPWWLAVLLAFQLFFIINGTVTYFVRARRARAEGQQPAPYFRYLFFAGRNPYSDNVPMPPLLRGVIGVVFVLAGAAFMLFGVAVPATLMDLSQTEDLVKGVATLALTWTFGLPIAYVGYRLLVMEENEAMLRMTDANARRSPKG